MEYAITSLSSSFVIHMYVLKWVFSYERKKERHPCHRICTGYIVVFVHGLEMASLANVIALCFLGSFLNLLFGSDTWVCARDTHVRGYVCTWYIVVFVYGLEMASLANVIALCFLGSFFKSRSGQTLESVRSRLVLTACLWCPSSLFCCCFARSRVTTLCSPCLFHKAPRHSLDSVRSVFPFGLGKVHSENLHF